MKALKLFIHVSELSLKAVLIHNGNQPVTTHPHWNYSWYQRALWQYKVITRIYGIWKTSMTDIRRSISENLSPSVFKALHTCKKSAFSWMFLKYVVLSVIEIIATVHCSNTFFEFISKKYICKQIFKIWSSM